MPSTVEGATIVVHLAATGRNRLVLARISTRLGDGDMELDGPMLVTGVELAATVAEVVRRLSLAVAGEQRGGVPPW